MYYNSEHEREETQEMEGKETGTLLNSHFLHNMRWACPSFSEGEVTCDIDNVEPYLRVDKRREQYCRNANRSFWRREIGSV